ncbi:hypothetical protein ACRAWF_45670 [Streptomyces sp. L7]
MTKTVAAVEKKSRWPPVMLSGAATDGAPPISPQAGVAPAGADSRPSSGCSSAEMDADFA